MSAALLPTPPVRVFDVVVRRAQDLTPHFRRITLAGGALDRFGRPGPTLDLRIRLLLPVPGHLLSRPGTPDGQLHEGWYRHWLRGEQPGRGFMRSYTVRALRTTPAGRELDVDFVIHAGPGGHGPSSDWARGATPGTAAVIIGPDAGAITGDTSPREIGIRWAPHGARQVLLAGDETAVPAISSILETLPPDVTGHAFLEVPDPSDFQAISTESAVGVTWLARNPSGAPRGALVQAAVEASGRPSRPVTAQEMYAWVGAESGTVRSLRRYLVHQVGLSPKRSEFRGYWSLGKAGSGAGT